jgi:hypothetical protein
VTCGVAGQLPPETPKPRRIQVGSGEQATIEGTSERSEA